MSSPLLKVEKLIKFFSTVPAVNDVSFEVRKGETLGLVGESGSGKSTLGRCIARLLEVDSGNIYYQDQNITHLKGSELRNLRKNIQFVFQDPSSSLNPKMTVRSLLEEPLIIHNLAETKKDRLDRVRELLSSVGLNETALEKFPHEFSGGQRQRIGIARALAVEPELMICDEPLSALDVSIQSQILKLLQDLQQKLGLTYIFIAHDLKVVRHISNRVAVMSAGKIVELADTNEIYLHPKHAYTKTLLASILNADPKARQLI